MLTRQDHRPATRQLRGQPIAALTAFLALLTAPLGASDPGNPCQSEHPPMHVVVDSARHNVMITVGPCTLPPMDMSMMMPSMGMGAGGEYSGKVDIRTRFLWPVTGYLRGWDLTMLDSLGHEIPQSTMHHMELVNFDRRQLVYTMAERVLGIGEETQPAIIPKSVGMPLNRGSHMGLYIMWNNETDTDMKGIYLRLRMPWAPSNMTPRPLTVLPFKVDVNMHPGRGDAFDFPEGAGSKATEFTVPIAGRLIAIGGHLHDYGKELRIEDVATGKVIARVSANRRPDGTVSSVAHRLFGIWGRGPHLIPGRTYRMVAVYENPTGKPIMAAMGLIGGIFAPDDMRQWPKVDYSDHDYMIDLGDWPTPDKWNLPPLPN